jgi:competence protein ComEA
MEQPKLTAVAPPATREIALLATWPRCVQVAVGVLIALGIGFLLGRSHGSDFTSHDPDSPPAGETSGPRLDLNRATLAELALVPGLGSARAQSIADHREQHGPFGSIDELRNVPGVGPRTLEKIRPWLFVARPRATPPPLAALPPTTARPNPPATAPAKAKKEVNLTAPINVNLATVAELQKLPGVGPKTAQRIVDNRTLHGPFKTTDELRRVPGIGPKTLEKLRPYVVVDPPTR